MIFLLEGHSNVEISLRKDGALRHGLDGRRLAQVTLECTLDIEARRTEAPPPPFEQLHRTYGRRIYIKCVGRDDRVRFGRREAPSISAAAIAPDVPM